MSAKLSKYRTISVYRDDADKIDAITAKKPNTIIADTVKEGLCVLDPDCYLLVIEGEEHVQVVSDALNKYLIENKIDHKVTAVDESEFVAMLAGLYLSGVRPVVLSTNPEGGDPISKK